MFRVVTLRKTASMCPAQWEGTLDDGRCIYIRYRYGVLSVGIGVDRVDSIRHSATTPVAEVAHGDDFAGVMNLATLKSLLSGFILPDND